MTANVVHELGVAIGKKSGDDIYGYNREIYNAVEAGNTEVFEKIVKEKNAKHNIWGWKRPKAQKKLRKI